jgi:hypothetical protein
LVPTLSALVPASAAGLLAEVVIADAGSRDATADVADIAGCRFTSSTEALGTRLKAAAATVRSPWVMFLRAGAVPQPGWIEAVDHFIQTTRALRSPAVQGPNRACSSHAAYTMRLVGIPQEMTPRSLSCAVSAAKDWSSYPPHSRCQMLDFVK